MIDAPTRLRRAIHLHDLVLVQRIIKSNAVYLRNPDFSDRNNSSLHLAAILGYLDIVVCLIPSHAVPNHPSLEAILTRTTQQFLVEAGHEAQGISKNLDGNTALMEAIDTGQAEVAAYLARSFTRCIDWKNRLGLDATMLASRAGLADLVSLFISLHETPNELLSAVDIDGSTALHYASGYGQLKCLRVLLISGADPMAENNFRCTPALGARTKDVGTYFLSLVREIEVRKLEGRERDKEMAKRQQSGVRVVSNTSSIGQAISSADDEDDAMLDPPRTVFGSMDSGRQSPARMWRGDGRTVFGAAGRSRAGSYEQQP